ncbi:protein of unknown function - conserved [Leishmania donovani]|uniref:BAG domain-containing protein n=3 Tax=Leishmania donovani species complex TaxID=38574 RepID=A4HZP2_LEIIN|nr:conserved hypothetical protein [Leishmania infantum JPCM5]CAC9487480.1 hypothetical_protein_-_conserved [Leishmania infantum]CAJ1988711.1 protein of unknown function - conserved [Leishmania donovani]CAM67956.1 conserved hypothetical protein [Leishmania infantum JPCM5]SUZ41704.1 hypothetical_protein_-_conserved [Leishmania infantum]VDZ44591.1 hypothetical_protein_conserved [Leishmania donovani]|eukprot:XP_001465533.1 conserved hypothetical protein [Leishmania infantum JPCM5]
MAYYGSQPEQTKAQIRSTRGETIDLALPVTCLVGELRSFLIEEYGYDPNTRLLYNGLVADDNSYVCDYPFGSLMIATPADTHSQRQSLPPRQPAVAHVPPQQQQQEPNLESSRPTAHLSPTVSTSADAVRKSKTAEPMPTYTSAAARTMSPAEAPPDTAKAKRSTTVLKHRPKNSARQLRSISTESTGSQNRLMKGDGTSDTASSVPAASPQPPPPPLSAANNGASPAPGSGRVQLATGQRNSPWPQGSQNATAAPSIAAPSQAADLPPSPRSEEPSVAAEVPSGEGGNDDDNQRRRVQLTVECHIPSLNQVVPVSVNGDSSVSDLILAVAAAVPELKPDAQVVHRGKLLPVSPKAKLFDHGIRSDARVFIAEGDYNNAEKITLLEIQEDIAVIERAMESPLTDLQRKGYYEELMRILFRTDGLQSLEGEWRQRRKDAVKHITSLQDALGVDVKES